MAEWKMTRFWTKARATEVPSGFAVALDDKPIRTPAKAPLVVPTRALAQAIAAEWDAQVDHVDPTAMPVTRAANSAIDKVAPQREAVIAMLAEYGRTDLLSYRAQGPAGLQAAQAAAWDPMLDWAAHTYGARLTTTAGVMPVVQNEDAIGRLAAPLNRMSPFELTAMHDLVALTGSLVLGLAASEGGHDARAVWDASRVDEDWQAREWGEDSEAQAAALRKRADFLAALEFLAQVRDHG